MKLMKHITIALVLCAIPAMAFAQTAQCEDCDHELSVYRSGGLIATAAGEAEMVNFRASCGGVTRTGQMMPNDDGVVSMLLSGDYACDAAGGTFELGPIADGGWFWIHVGDNSAVGNIVATDILMNDAATITDAGESVTMTAGKGAVLLEHAASGRVGILPTILPEPPATPPTPCGYKAGAAPNTFVQVNSGCMLGDGGTMVRIVTSNRFGASSHTVGTGQVTRAYSGDSTFTVDLWGNGTGHYTSDGTADARLGHASAAGSGPPLAAEFSATIAAGNTPGAGPAPADVGVAIATVDGVGTITVSPNATYCGTATKPLNHTVTINIASAVGTPGQVVPDIADANRAVADTQGASAMVTVVCPSASASANMGTELVPDNPFPTK